MSTEQFSLAKLFAVEPENDWRTSAACRTMDPALFFSSDGFESKQEKDERERAAKAVCVRCTVREACLDYALKAHERYGIWGGLNAQERRALVRKRAASERSERVS